MNKNHLTSALVASVAFVVLVIGVIIAARGKLTLNPGGFTPITITRDTKLEKFQSEGEFKSYIERGQQSASFYYGGGRGAALDLAVPNAAPSAQKTEASVERTSTTNVQVKGVDEPDILKTDGKNLYFSRENYGIYPLTKPGFLGSPVAEDLIYPGRVEQKTDIVGAFPPSSLAKMGVIDKSGELLLYQSTLVVFSYDAITAYEVSDPKNPVQKWKVELDNTEVVASRLINDKIYLVTRRVVNIANPCPIPLFKVGGQSITVPCVNIYHPVVDTAVDTTFTASSINPLSGEVNAKDTFVGSSGNSIVYVSPNAIYVTYAYSGNYLDYYYNFLNEKAQDLIPDTVMNKLSQLKSYDLSNQSKLNELQIILEQYKSSLSMDDRLKLENELNNRAETYAKAHARELSGTGIVKINIPSLGIAATGGVSGTPLNQFSLDEYRDNLRIATTTGNNFYVQSESVNDLYILDSDLKITGSILDLGVGERIYSARFIEDKGYLVTFKQVDPFFVFDLSDPKNPRKTGELKIPGYSSYLHPLKPNLILGVGQENSGVKLAIFSVSDPANPIEISKYNLDEYWTEVQNNHHAFLMDEKHSVFFIPGGKGGYIFSFEGNTLALKKAVSGIQTKRAVYINDYLYIVGEDKIIVLDENNWSEVSRLDL